MPEQQDLAFQLFKVAQEKYGEAIDKLEKPQYDDALRIAQRKIRIEEAVLSSSAAAKVSVPANQIDEALEQIRGRYEEESDFYTDIQRVGIDETFFYQALSRELHVEAILDFISSDCDGVTETEISLYYYMIHSLGCLIGTILRSPCDSRLRMQSAISANTALFTSISITSR